MEGKLILVVGPSGSGKSALLSYLHQQMPDILFPVSCTTRAMRPGEVEGQKYNFITKEVFEQRVAAGDFVEWAVYGGNYYGTPKTSVDGLIEAGKTLVHEIEVQGAKQLLALMPPGVVRVIFIDAGSWEDLERRIRARAPIGEPELLARRKRYEDEITFKKEADAVVQNPDGGLEQAKADFVAAVQSLTA